MFPFSRRPRARLLLLPRHGQGEHLLLILQRPQLLVREPHALLEEQPALVLDLLPAGARGCIRMAAPEHEEHATTTVARLLIIMKQITKTLSAF